MPIPSRGSSQRRQKRRKVHQSQLWIIVADDVHDITLAKLPGTILEHNLQWHWFICNSGCNCMCNRWCCRAKPLIVNGPCPSDDVLDVGWLLNSRVLFVVVVVAVVVVVSFFCMLSPPAHQSLETPLHPFSPS
jgi:hypothetical protein